MTAVGQEVSRGSELMRVPLLRRGLGSAGPQDKREPKVMRRPLGLVGGAVFAISLAAFFRTPLLPDIGRDLSLSASQLSLITAAFAVGRLAMDLPAGRFADGHSPHRVLAGAGFILCIASLWLGMAQSLVHALGAAALLGVASSVTNTTGMAQFSSRVPDDRRGAALAIFSMSLLSGQTFGPALGGLVAAWGTWRTAQVAAAAIGAGVVLVCLLRRSPAPSHAPEESVAPDEHDGAGHGDFSRAERVVLGLIPFTVFFTLASLPNTLVPLIGADDLGLPAATIGLVLGAGGLSRFVGAAAAGTISDHRSRKAALIPGLALMAVGTAVLALPPTFVSWTAAILLMSLGSSGVAVAATILGDRAPPGRMGRRLSSFRFTADLGLLCGPILTGWIYETAGRAESVLLVAAMLASCALAATALAETHPARAGTHDRPFEL
ncbi:MAG: MFS transporter [Actinomycetota bacterium]